MEKRIVKSNDEQPSMRSTSNEDRKEWCRSTILVERTEFEDEEVAKNDGLTESTSSPTRIYHHPPVEIAR